MNCIKETCIPESKDTLQYTSLFTNESRTPKEAFRYIFTV